MSQQDDVNNAIAEAKASTESAKVATAKLLAAAEKLKGLNIPSPVDTSGLAPAMADNAAALADLTTAGNDMSAAVDAEAAKMNPTGG